MWRQFLNESSATSSRVYVIAERADDLAPEILRALDSLTAADANGSLGANLVLLGEPALLDTLKSPTLESLRQRIRLRQRLEPLTQDELRAYVDHHVKLAGGQLDRLFARDALAALHELSGGIPRLANSFCETALTLAATRKEPLVTAELLKHVAVDLLGIEPARATDAVVAAPAPGARPQADQKQSQPPARTVSDEKPVATPAVQRTDERSSAPVAGRAPQREPIVAREPVVAAPVARPAEPPPARAAAEPPPSRASAEAGPRLITESPVIAPTPAVSQAKPTAAAGPRPATAVSPSAPTSAPAPAVAPVAARPARTLQATPAPAQTAPASAAPAVSAPAAAPTHTAAPAQPASRIWPGPPDPDLDAFADTLTDSADVPMLDLPVLTDAVEPARARPRADTAYLKPPLAPTPAAAAAKPATPLPRVVAPASTAAAAQMRAAKPAQAAPAPAPAPAPAQPAASAAKPPPPPRPAPPPAPADDEDLLHQTQTMRGLMAAKSIDDISDSMAETLFGDEALDTLSAALAASGWSEDDASASASSSAPAPAATPAPAPAPAATPAPARASTAKPAAPSKPAPPPDDDDPFAFLGLGPDVPLELIDDPEPAPTQRKEGTRNR
jgi:hypothetical protein